MNVGLEFAAIAPFDSESWDELEAEEEWDATYSVLYDLPCATGGLVAVRLLRNLCRAKPTFAESVLDEGGELWRALLPFLCWCRYAHPRAETVGVAVGREDGRLWATQLLECLAEVAPLVVGSITWVYFWLLEALPKALGSSDLRLAAAAVGLLRNLSTERGNCRRLFVMPAGAPFIAQLLPAALSLLSPLGLLRFGEQAPHSVRPPQVPLQLEAEDHAGGRAASAAAEMQDRLESLANSLRRREQHLRTVGQEREDAARDEFRRSEEARQPVEKRPKQDKAEPAKEKGYKVGEEVEVYSRSNDKWFKGKVTGVDSRLETVDLEYSDAEGPLNKTLESDSEHLRKLPSAKPKEEAFKADDTERESQADAEAREARQRTQDERLELLARLTELDVAEDRELEQIRRMKGGAFANPESEMYGDFAIPSKVEKTPMYEAARKPRTGMPRRASRSS